MDFETMKPESDHMEQDWQQHECLNIPDEISICFSTKFLPSGDKKWSLNISRTKTAEDLEENHYFEQEGETVWETSVEVLYCPFCGEKLAEEGALACEHYGERHSVSYTHSE